MNKKTLRFLEIVWLIVSVLTLGAAVHKGLTSNWKESIVMFVLFGLSFLFYLYRRQCRIMSGKNDK